MLRIIFWTVVIVVLLSFFGISVQSLFENPQTQSNFGFILGYAQEGWGTIWAAIAGLATTIVTLIQGLLPS
jgi:hypothetical protein